MERFGENLIIVPSVVCEQCHWSRDCQYRFGDNFVNFSWLISDGRGNCLKFLDEKKILTLFAIPTQTEAHITA